MTRFWAALLDVIARRAGYVLSSEHAGGAYSPHSKALLFSTDLVAERQVCLDVLLSGGAERALEDMAMRAGFHWVGFTQQDGDHALVIYPPSRVGGVSLRLPNISLAAAPTRGIQ